VWAGTEWMKVEPEEDTIDEGDETSSPAATLLRNRRRADIEPSSSPTRRDSGDAAATSSAPANAADASRMSIFGGIAGMTGDQRSSEHPMVRAAREDSGLASATEMPRKRQIDDTFALMENLRKRTDAQAYVPSLDPELIGKPTRRVQTEPEAASVDELMMAKPKIATRIRQSTYGGNSSLPRENDEDDHSNGGGGEDDEPSTAF
jgi:hypothetical protein